ncbi:hypothetical protein D3C79_745170 [compost metagenome]
MQALFDTADITDADRKKGWLEAIILEVLVNAPIRRHFELATDVVIGMKQPRLVNPSRTQLSIDARLQFEGFWQKVQVTTDLLGFHEGFALFGLPASLGLAIRHHQHRAADLLAETRALGDVLYDVVTQLLTLTNQAADHEQRDQQQHNQQGDGAKFQTQGSTHGATLRFR